MESSRKSQFLKALLLWIAIAALMTWFLIYIDYKPDVNLVAPILNWIRCLPVWKIVVIQAISSIISGAVCVELVYRAIAEEFVRDQKYLAWSIGVIILMIMLSFAGLYFSRSEFGNACT